MSFFKEINDTIDKSNQALAVHLNFVENIPQMPQGLDFLAAIMRQRLIMAIPFEDLLGRGIDQAHLMQQEKIRQSLMRNLNDEKGVGGIPHSVYREKFGKTLGIDTNSLNIRLADHSSQTYIQTMSDLKKASLNQVAGAIFAIEGTVPTEFRAIIQAYDALVGDREGRFYLADHIQHDTDAHRVDLQRVLEKYTTTTKILGEIREGVIAILASKAAFYDIWAARAGLESTSDIRKTKIESGSNA